MMKRRKPHPYLIAIDHPGGPRLVIDWGNCPDWLATYAEELATATRVTLIPRNNGRQVFTAVIPEPGDWEVKARTMGQIGIGHAGQNGHATNRQIKIYHVRVGQVKVWIYPDNTVETADQPTLGHLFLEKLTWEAPPGSI